MGNFRKAKQVIVREHLEDSKPYVFSAILLEEENVLVAMDNGAILNPSWEWIEIIEELPWINLSEEMGGDYFD